MLHPEERIHLDENKRLWFIFYPHFSHSLYLYVKIRIQSGMKNTRILLLLLLFQQQIFSLLYFFLSPVSSADSRYHFYSSRWRRHNPMGVVGFSFSCYFFGFCSLVINDVLSGYSSDEGWYSCTTLLYTCLNLTNVYFARFSIFLPPLSLLFFFFYYILHEFKNNFPTTWCLDYTYLYAFRMSFYNFYRVRANPYIYSMQVPTFSVIVTE